MTGKDRYGDNYSSNTWLGGFCVDYACCMGCRHDCRKGLKMNMGVESLGEWVVLEFCFNTMNVTNK